METIPGRSGETIPGRSGETISGRSGEAERDDQVPGSVVKTEVGSPEQALIVCVKDEVATPTDMHAFIHTGMVQDTFGHRENLGLLQQLNVQASVAQENTDYSVGAEHGDRNIKAPVDKPFPVALYKVDRTLRTNSRLVTNSSTPDSTERQLDLSLDAGHTESSNIADTGCANYSNINLNEPLHDERSYRCISCSYSCGDKSNLRRHTRIHTGDKPYKCSLCSYSCTKKCSLKIHQMIHSSEKPYKCSSCSFSTAHQRSLQKHLQSHTGEKPHKCSSCPYRTAHLSSLKNHMRTHTGEKPYTCTVCPYSCALKSNLQTHMRTHTGEKPYKCPSCSYSCSRNANLIDHQRVHTGEKPYKCSSCSFSSAYQRGLHRHRCKSIVVNKSI